MTSSLVPTLGSTPGLGSRALGARARSCRGSRRGFTLVELMVAISTGLMVAAAAFLLAKVSLNAFQQDARVNNAQQTALTALQRLTTDLKRAGYMATPFITEDPSRCGPVPPAASANWLIGANIFEGNPGGGNFLNIAAYGIVGNEALPVVATGAENLRAPDRLSIAGNLMGNEVFRYRRVNTATMLVELEVDSNAVQRVFRDSPPGAQTVCRFFPGDRMARLLDDGGKETYVQLVPGGCVETPSGSFLSAVTVQIAVLGGGALPSGTCSPAAGGSINVVNVVEYSVQQVAQPLDAAALAAEGLQASMQPIVAWSPLMGGDGISVLGEDTRMDLIRRERDYNGAIIPNSGEVLGEWVADFKMRVRYVANPGGTALTDSGFHKEDGGAGEPIRPQRIRAVGVRLSTRSREADREQQSQPGVPIPDAQTPLDRFRVFPAGANRTNLFARVRTAYAEVHLSNYAQVNW